MYDLEKQAEQLRNKALNIIKDFDLEKFLSKFGEVQIVGSVALNLMTWRDIDIHVFCEKKPNKGQLMEITTHTFSKAGARKITCIDYQDHRLSKNIANKPEGQYLGVEYIDSESNQWKMDIWLLDKDKMKRELDLKDKITSENRRAILEIKNHYHSHPKYRNQFGSVDIYDAVLNKNINSVDQFAEIIKEKGIE